MIEDITKIMVCQTKNPHIYSAIPVNADVCRVRGSV